MLMLAAQRAFPGILLIVLGLELLETLRVYFTNHRVRLELVIVVALIVALTGGYYLFRKAVAQDSETGGLSR